MSVRLLRFLALFALLTGGSAAVAETAPSGEFRLPDRPVWAGETFDLGLVWRVDWDAFSHLEGPVEWEPGALLAEPWQGPTRSLLPSQGSGGLAAISYRTRVLAVEPGSLALPPARQAMVVRTGVVRTSEYERAVTTTVVARTKPAVIEVRPLPPAPAGFTGAVGRFSLRASLSTSEAVVGERLTWTLHLSGAGNWPAVRGLPERRVSDAFESAGKPRLSDVAGAGMFERSLREEVDLVATRPGRHVLGPVEMAVFDPERGGYVRLRTPPLELQVRPAGTAGAERAGGGRAASLPSLLAGRGSSEIPMTQLQWRIALLLPVSGVVALWLLLALLRARHLDPEREARRSHARLGRTIRQLERAETEAERRRLVRAWQRDVALRWKLARASPIPASFIGHDAWSQIWAEADLFLYGRSQSLPPDWTGRAQRLLSEQGAPPAFEPSSMFSRRNLYPLQAVAALAAIFLDSPVAGAPPAAPETAFLQKVERDPLDWKARHNLAVSLASRERWEEAAAHAAIAWVQQPSEPATRRLWTRLAGEAELAGGAANGVPLPAGWRGRLVAAASPALWQWIATGFVALAAAGAMLLLLVGYGRAARKARIAAFLLLGVGGLGALTCWTCLRAYGPLARQDAVLLVESTPLRRLPVEAPVGPGAVMLGAGSAAWVDGSFLGWRRLRLADGRSGWVRQQALAWAWRNPA